ncbi:hypothetical protein NKR19_g4541 [Coniochaeta hoffmannii]|uniref:Uncharacterized protein n=1 Tax=Coniochaeta hoffmannii TaxID=91930 RepID=A0AA38RQ88_9PEZI|nr:hypothetical protein NKR19_g4541 [Coniochaeta hoffmannii]
MNEALEEIRRIEAALPADVGRGGDFPNRHPTTGRWTGVAPPEQPTERRDRATAAATTRTSRPPLPRPTTGPRRRLPGQSLPTIHEIRAYDGYQLGGSVPSPAPSRIPPPPPPPAPIRRGPQPPVARLPADQQQRSQQTPALVSATLAGEEWSDSSSDYGQGPLVQGDSTTSQRQGLFGLRGTRSSGLRGIVSGFCLRRRHGSQRLARPARRSAWEDQIDMWDVDRYRIRSGGEDELSG